MQIAVNLERGTVEFKMAVDGSLVTCTVAREVLQQRYQAGRGPADWVLAFQHHEGEIIEAAERLYRDRPSNPLRVRRLNSVGRSADV